MQMIELEITEGNFTDGFDVRLDIRGGSNRVPCRIDGTLPPKLDMNGFYQLWYHQYEALVTNQLGLAQNVAHGGDISSCQNRFQAWTQTVNQWLQSHEMLKIDRALSSAFAAQPRSTQFNIKLDTPKSSTDDWTLLWKLPWYSWEILQEYPYIEPILTPATAASIAHPAFKRKKSRILAITGGNKSTNTTGNEEWIDLKGSINELKKLHRFELVYLDQPSEQEFSATLNNVKGWDILFFTGHSGMDNAGGWFELNSTTKIRSKPFQLTLQTACQNGLQLAVFSSCDGVQLAQDLSAFNVPTIIAMREIIPNTVAQQFIQGLVQSIVTSTAASCHLTMAIRTARATLEGCTHYPGATNLPMVFQRSPHPLSTWQELCPQPSDSMTMLWRSLPILLAISLMVAGVVMGVRSLGWLQSSELAAYNRLMQSRPTEEPDRRLLIVGVDEGDLREYGDPIPDGVFAEALDILNQHQPRAIGLDVYRDIPLPPGRKKLIHQINSNSNVISICLISPSDAENSIAPPAVNREEPFSGFVDFYTDESINPSDPTLRRYLLSKHPNPVEDNISKCSSNYSFAILLVDKYLSFSGEEVNKDSKNNWIIDDLTIRPLKQKSGGYSRFDDRGYQILINYKNIENFKKIAQQINLRSLLNNPHSFYENWIKDRVVLIGIVAASKDNHHTPYGRMHGVTVHAHVVSQILSAIEDDRPIINWWSEKINFLWILGWSLLTSIITFLPLNYFIKGFLFFILTVSIWVISLLYFSIMGLWLISIAPLIGSYLSITATIGYLNLRKRNNVI